LSVAIVADRPARVLDPAGERRLADEAITPDLVEQLLLGHHPVAMRHEKNEDVEYLGLDVHGHSRPAQLERDSVDLSVAEGEGHRRLTLRS
jgi:hypothetical protein